LTRKDIFRYIFWEWIEPIGSALGIALLVMHFVVALYVIPTGSMQPTLHGAGDYGIGDKVIVNKFIYRFQPPQRWDVFVFLYPYKNVACSHCETTLIQTFPADIPEVVPTEVRCPNPACFEKSIKFDFVEKEYIKRCVGLPGDEIAVRDGNIVFWDGQAFHPSLKTREAQEALWIKAFDSQDPKYMEMPQVFWKDASQSIARWEPKSVPTLKAGGETLLFHNLKALMGRGDKAKPDPELAPPVGDIAIDLEASHWPKSGELELDISRNVSSHQLTIDFSKQTWTIGYRSVEVASGKWDPKTLHLRFGRVDGHLQMLMDDNWQRWPIPNDDVDDICHSIFPKVRYQSSESFSPDRLQVLRDIYYTDNGEKYLSGPRRSYKLRSGEFFAMGDNAYHSYDSRGWGPVPEEKLIGKALVVLFPLGRTKFIH
jgi:signal peptidase I